MENSSEEIQALCENIQNETLRNIILKISKEYRDKKISELQRDNQQLSWQIEGLREKLSQSEKTNKFKKNHLEEYMKEIQVLRERVVELEDNNQKLRINFDNTIMNIETKVGNEKQKILDSVVNDYRSEISKKNERIQEMEVFSKNT